MAQTAPTWQQADVAVVSHLFARTRGGFVRAQVAALHAVGVGVDAVSIEKPWERSAPDVASWRYIALPRSRPRAAAVPLARLSLRAAQRRHKWELPKLAVHAHGFFPDALPFVGGAVPLVVTSHAAQPERFYAPNRDLVRYVARNAAAVLVPNPVLIESTAAALRIETARVIHVDNAVAAEFFRGTRDWGERALRVLFVGNLVPEKGVDRAIRICEHLMRLAAPRPVLLTVVGSGARVCDLKSSRVPIRHVAAVTSEQLSGIMRQHEVLLSASSWESFGAVMAEALAAGLPVVATDTAGSAYVLANAPGCDILSAAAPDAAFAQRLLECVDRDTVGMSELRHDIARERWGSEIVGSMLRRVYMEVAAR